MKMHGILSSIIDTFEYWDDLEDSEQYYDCVLANDIFPLKKGDAIACVTFHPNISLVVFEFDSDMHSVKYNLKPLEVICPDTN
jgi:hypothetical protein